MAERLTKTEIKSELRRRIDWLEQSYPPIRNITSWTAGKYSPLMLLEAGRYQAYLNMLEQVDRGLFIGGGK